jgi:hypothetical protein
MSVRTEGEARSPQVTICVLTFGNHPRLAVRVMQSILTHCPRHEYRLVVGANQVCDETLKLLTRRREAGDIDHLIVSPTNLNKCPMMRRMFQDVRTDFIWWFDDDSYVTDAEVFGKWLNAGLNSPPKTVMWGQMNWCDSTIGFNHYNEKTTLDWVRTASWYRGLPPPSWRPGGKGEFNFNGRSTGDGRWYYLAGGCWLIRTTAVRTLDWPDSRLVKMGDDTFLGEAIRQQGWCCIDIDCHGVAINTEPRRGERG